MFQLSKHTTVFPECDDFDCTFRLHCFNIAINKYVAKQPLVLRQDKASFIKSTHDGQTVSN